MPKLHWCPLCRWFYPGIIRRLGYYSTPKICCSRCSYVLGTPESDDA